MKLAIHISIAVCLTAAPAAADSWDKAIMTVGEKSNTIWQRARQNGYDGPLGSIYNELHSNEHSCAILGRMLDKAELIVAAERSAEMDEFAADPHDMALAAHSLDNWVHNARRLKDTDEDRKIREWNLDCVGKYAIPDNAFIAETAATFYDVDGTTLRVFGDVEIGYADKLIEALQKHPEISTVALGSAGGSVSEALRAGIFIRQAGLETTLWNNCYSACTMVFISGTKRTVWSPYPELGFHQISSHGVAIPLDSPSYERLYDYARLMGLSPLRFIQLTQSAPPESFTILKGEDLCTTGVATWVQRLCGF